MLFYQLVYFQMVLGGKLALSIPYSENVSLKYVLYINILIINIIKFKIDNWKKTAVLKKITLLIYKLKNDAKTHHQQELAKH